MEYSPDCAIPYLSRVDAGTAEAVRRRGVEIVSSGDLVQRFEAAWTADQLASHRAASEALYRIKDRAFAAAAAALRDGAPLTEYDLQQQMVGWFEEEGLVSDSAPVVAVGAQRRQSALPAHGRAARGRSSPTRCCCSTSGASSTTPGAVFADITWVGFTGRSVPTSRPGRSARSPRRATRRSRWSKTRRAPGATCAAGRSIGRRATVLEQAGYGDRILHRTGHSLGESVHGNGVHLDDYETHDDRRLLPGHRLHDRAGAVFRDVRRADRDQHVSRRARGAGDGAAPDGDNRESMH